MNRLTTLYKHILEAVGGTVNPDHTVTGKYGDVDVPVEVEGKDLILPADEVLRNPDWSNTIAFHPLCENVARGESPVLKTLRKMALLRVHDIVSRLATELMTIAADTERHRKLDPVQSEFLSRLPEADDKMVSALNKVLTQTSIDGQNRLISLYLKRGGKLKDTKYARLSVFSMPIMDADEKERAIFDVKLRVRDFHSILALFDFILPGGNDNEYSYGSQSKTAPYLHAMMLSYVKVAQQLNQVVERFANQLTDADSLRINLDWESELGCLADMLDLIPVLDGNQGPLGKNQKEEVVQQTPVTKAPVTRPTVTPATPTTPVTSTPAPTSKPGAVPWNSVSQPQMQQQPMNPNMPYGQPYGGYPPQQPPSHPGWPGANGGNAYSGWNNQQMQPQGNMGWHQPTQPAGSYYQSGGGV